MNPGFGGLDPGFGGLDPGFGGCTLIPIIICSPSDLWEKNFMFGVWDAKDIRGLVIYRITPWKFNS